MKFTENNMELDISDLQNAKILAIENKKKDIYKILQDPHSRSVDDLFYRVTRNLRKIAEERSEDPLIHQEIAELLYYDQHYYEQLLVNIGLEFKLKIFALINQGLKYDTVLDRIRLEVMNRLKMIVSKPLIDIYVQKDENRITEKEGRRVITSVLTALEESIDGLIGCITHLITSRNSDSSYNLQYTHYLISLEYLVEGILYSLYGHLNDTPYTALELLTYSYCEKFLWCFISPASDPLISFYREELNGTINFK